MLYSKNLVCQQFVKMLPCCCGILRLHPCYSHFSFLNASLFPWLRLPSTLFRSFRAPKTEKFGNTFHPVLVFFKNAGSVLWSGPAKIAIFGNDYEVTRIRFSSVMKLLPAMKANFVNTYVKYWFHLIISQLEEIPALLGKKVFLLNSLQKKPDAY